ncbi:MAG: hypothetical protein HFACDABA_02057 [Anaerolineales bacterium]|nr:hypothetical protein [Anaerolineales bacterium]
MNAISPTRASFVIVIWPESHDETLQWRGTVEAASGARFYFHTLTDLNRIVRELGGWQDPPTQTLEKEKNAHEI